MKEEMPGRKIQNDSDLEGKSVDGLEDELDYISGRPGMEDRQAALRAEISKRRK